MGTERLAVEVQREMMTAHNFNGQSGIVLQTNEMAACAGGYRKQSQMHTVRRRMPLVRRVQ